MPVDALLSLKSSGVVVQDGTDVYEAITGKIPIESLRLGWLAVFPRLSCFTASFFYISGLRRHCFDRWPLAQPCLASVRRPVDQTDFAGSFAISTEASGKKRRRI